MSTAAPPSLRVRVRASRAVHDAANGKRPRVSVILRCKNSADTITQVLAGLFSQRYTDFELVVVDSGSTDQTLDIVRKYPCRLVTMDPGRYFSGAALNLGMENAQGDIFVTINSDCVPLHPETLTRLLAPFDDPDVMATFARQMPRPEAWTWVRHEVNGSFPPAGDPPSWIVFTVPLAALRRTAWQEHPFFIDAWGSEDTEWGLWAKSRGYRIVYVPDAWVMHSHNHSLPQLYGRLFTEGEAMALIHKTKESAVRSVARTLHEIVRDVLAHLRDRDFGGMRMVPIRRIVCRWAYYHGHKLGERRLLDPSIDAFTGQRIILARYEKKARRR